MEQIGTCFPISTSGVYATAAHLFRVFADVRHELKKPEILRKDRLSYQYDEMRVGICRFIGEREKTTRLFEFVSVLNLFLDHDIALLFVNKPGRLPENFPRFPIVERPQIGSDISILGYPSGDNLIWEDGGKRNAQIALVESKGKLTKEFSSGRDAGLAWFPCFETSARMKAGHSGGPAILPNIPAVVGVNSSSGDAEHSIISWLGKVVDSEFELDDWEMNLGDGRKFNMKGFSIRKMAELGLASII
ncbi:MAG: serine protease [Spirochaetia bacterium]|nr:serine protease [Spirochaetia bacterium]